MTPKSMPSSVQLIPPSYITRDRARAIVLVDSDGGGQQCMMMKFDEDEYGRRPQFLTPP